MRVVYRAEENNPAFTIGMTLGGGEPLGAISGGGEPIGGYWAE